MAARARDRTRQARHMARASGPWAECGPRGPRTLCIPGQPWLRWMDARWAWRAKFASAPTPWSGPVHAEPMLAGLAGRVVELGAGGGKVGAALSAGVVALDWVREGLRDAS